MDLSGHAAFRTPPPARIGAGALATVTRQLATLVGSDVRVEEALRLVARLSPPAVAAPLILLRDAVVGGQGLAAAMAAQPRAFPDYYRASVAAAEQAGTLAEVLAHLADFVDARARSAWTLGLALLYPVLLAGVSLAMMVALLVYVVPDITRVFVMRGVELPLLTRGLIALSGGVHDYGLGALAVLLAGGLACRRWLAVPANRLAVDRLVATAGLARQASAARFAATLAMLVRTGVPLVDAIATAALVVPNRFIRLRAQGVVASVREGAPLSRAMTDAGVFPPMLIAIVASGEGSGRLGAVLTRAAADMDRDLAALVAALTALIEPAVLLAMGLMVLLMVLSILLPIINLNDLAGM